MSSRRKTYSKSHCDRSASDGSSSQHKNVVPERGICGTSDRSQGGQGILGGHGSCGAPDTRDMAPFPVSCQPRGQLSEEELFKWTRCHSKFLRSSGVSRVSSPLAGEVAESPPDGYFTCFKAYLMQCHLWFPLPEAVVQLFSSFGLEISQVTPRGLHHVVRIQVLSYKRGLPIDADHL